MTHRTIAFALAFAALAALAPAAPLADRLPAGASMVAEADFSAFRASKLIDQEQWAAAPGPEVLERAGIRLRRDVDRLAVGALPGAGEGGAQDVVALLSGRFDAAKVKAALLAQGARPVKLGDFAAWKVTGDSSLTLHPSLPSIDIAGDQVVVSFLGDLLVLGTERGTRLAHGPKLGLPSPALAAARGSVPSSAAAWIALDLPSTGAQASGALAMAQGLKSITAWTTLGAALELRALARTADDKQATQIAALVTLLAGAAASSPEGKVLQGLDVKASGDSIQAALKLTQEQLRELAEQAASGT